jgi:hypothetical protein
MMTSDVAYAMVAIPLTGVLAAAFSRAFCPRGSVVRAYEAAAPGLLDGTATAAVRRALRSANARSFALAVGVSAFPVVASGVDVPAALPIGSLLSAFIVAAVTKDVWAEAAARERHPVLASAWPVHRVDAVDPVLAALSRAGIPAHARSRQYRVLFHVFAPYAPIEIFVPVERVADAEVVCARVLGDPT